MTKEGFTSSLHSFQPYMYLTCRLIKKRNFTCVAAVNRGI